MLPTVETSMRGEGGRVRKANNSKVAHSRHEIKAQSFLRFEPVGVLKFNIMNLPHLTLSRHSPR